MENVDPLEFLLFGLNHFSIEVTKQDRHIIHLTQEYVVEVEGPSLYKLIQSGQVIAPFADVEELCTFIKMDMQLNEKD